MKQLFTLNGRPGLRIAALAVVVVVGAWSATGASASPLAHKKPKGLSQASVIIGGGTSPSYAMLWVAEDQGFFKKQGLSVTYDTISSSAAALTTAAIAGAVQFLVNGVSNMASAAQAGGPLRAVALQTLDAAQEVVISASSAAAHNIPASGNGTEKGALAQLAAMKGSHLKIGVSTTTTDSYNWIVDVPEAHGLTSGLNCTTCDIDVVTTGSVPTLVAGLSSGQLDGFVNTPPTTVITSPATITVQLYKIPPLPKAEGNDLATTTTMIQQHSDTVQAVVTAVAEAMNFTHLHPKQAEKDWALQLATLGAAITSPEEQEYLFSTFQPFEQTPVLTKVGYNTEVSLWNAAQPAAAITIPYATFNVTKYVTAATKAIGAKWPAGDSVKF